jgi:hypothetical protein
MEVDMKIPSKQNLFFLLGIFVLIFGVNIEPAQAQDAKPENDESCVTCHANLYMLYDTGKWHCLCGTNVRCSACHGGTVGAVDEETAHIGMIANPLEHDGEICKSCHELDSAEKIASFAQIAGIHTFNEPVQPYETPCEGAAASTNTMDILLTPKPIETWRVAGLGAVSGLFFMMIIYAIRSRINTGEKV